MRKTILIVKKLQSLIALFVLLALLIGCNQKRDSNYAKIIEPSKEPITFSNEWKTASWQSFHFNYPTELELSDGALNDTFFYLDFNGKPEHMVRIYGISEKWSKPASEIIEKRKIDDLQGFPDYHFLDLKQKSNNTFVYCYTWKIGDVYKTCQNVKEYDQIIRYLTVSAPINVWHENNEVFEKIMSSIN